ncbi:MAG: hypothetical protein HUU10_10775 [Bacteroidetes bacterium]|nr:hypothetical protein [Bacteroidota bacterium]
MQGLQFHTRLTAVLTILVLFIQINSVAWLTFWFSFNQKEISETVCEKVVVECNGKCYLSKQIEKETQSEPARPISSKQDFKIKDKTDPVILLISPSNRFSEKQSTIPLYLISRLLRRTVSPESPPPDHA